MDSFDVSIADDPYSLIKEIMNIKEDVELRMDYDLLPEGTELVLKMDKKKDQLCLPLYSIKNGIKFVAEKSGLNQWNAGGRVRDANEIYIPYQAVDRNRKSDFFPPRDTPFILRLPDGSKISAKVCQEADRNNPLLGKAIMSNPNKILGKWLLRDVFELPERTLITYDMLEKFGIDSVIFTKNAEKDYSIIFSEIGAYEEFYAKEGE